MKTLSLAPKKTSSNRIEVIRGIQASGLASVSQGEEVNSSNQKFTLFWAMMGAIHIHSYVRAAMGSIGRAVVGTWWKVARKPGDKQGTRLQKKRLEAFYEATEAKTWTNVQDYYSVAYKFMIGAMYLRYFGQTAYKIHRNRGGDPIGFDHLPGLIVPNTDSNGSFRTPAFTQYLTSDLMSKVDYADPKDIIYIINPDWEGSPIGASDLEALAEFTLPLDIYLQTAARSYLENSAKPEIVYMLPQDVSDEAFNAFVAKLNEKYTGAANAGRNPVAVQGDLKILRVDDMPASVPYQEARKDTRDETLAVSGTGAALMGVSESLSSANIRETRRQFHESTMVPLLKFIELAFYEQVHLRLFKISGWILKFNQPDFLTAVERATVHMRYVDMGVLCRNEVREELGLEPVPGGDTYNVPVPPGSQTSNPPAGRQPKPDDPSATGEPTMDDQDPPRGDQNGDKPRDSMIRSFEEDEE